jgi:pyruvate/2-oxoglutarate dehydrogenase complex dihydrolipoamide acyltransferase (E2) component
VYVTPLVRKLAEETGVDLNTLVGSGVGGRIRKQDVLDAAGTPDPSEPDLVEEVQPDVPVATSEVDEVEESKEQVDMPEFIAPEDQPEASEDDLAETGLVEPEVADAEGTDAEGEDSNEKVEEESVEDTDAQKAEAAEIEEVAEVDLDEFDSDDMPEDEDREEHIEETAEDLVDEVEDKDDSEDVAVLESINIALEAERGEQHPISGSTEKISRLRATIARRMVDSLQNSAQLTATVEVDLTLISRLRSQVKDDFKAREGVSLTFLPFIAKAAIEALRAYPKVNARMDTEAGEIVYPKGVHLAIAVDTPKGLLVPVIKSAGDLTVSGLAKKIADLSARTRSNEITPDELQGGTFTITNYGSAGTLFDTPIVNQPQVAILGTGSIKRRPVVVDDPRLGEIIAIRDMMYLSLSYDHRLVDGADAARFLVMVKERLEGGDFGAQF